MGGAPAKPSGSRRVATNQDGLHPRLEEIVRRHLEVPHRRPVPDHATEVFDVLSDRVGKDGRPILLDAGCGTGDSARALARLNPDRLVLGIDKSAVRLGKVRESREPDNLVLVRGDLTALYPLIAEADWPIERHFLLYPNPWPKAAHVQRRWHGHAVFGDLLRVGRVLELRTNWQIYAEEFALALQIAGQPGDVRRLAVQEPLSPFEAKYAASGHELWQVCADLRRA